MANVNAPRGFIPRRHMSGRSIVQNKYTIASGYSTSLFLGDPLILSGTSNNVNIAVGTAGTPSVAGIGVFAGCEWTDSAGVYHFSSYWPASTVSADAVAFVWDDPNIIFEVQSATFALNDIGALVDFTYAAGSTKTGMSGCYLDSTTGTADKTFRLLGLVDRPNNAVGAYAKVECMYIEHALRGVIAGVGGV